MLAAARRRKKARIAPGFCEVPLERRSFFL
jgi:hypothetical protein